MTHPPETIPWLNKGEMGGWVFPALPSIWFLFLVRFFMWFFICFLWWFCWWFRWWFMARVSGRFSRDGPFSGGPFSVFFGELDKLDFWGKRGQGSDDWRRRGRRFSHKRNVFVERGGRRVSPNVSQNGYIPGLMILPNLTIVIRHLVFFFMNDIVFCVHDSFDLHRFGMISRWKGDAFASGL